MVMVTMAPGGGWGGISGLLEVRCFPSVFLLPVSSLSLCHFRLPGAASGARAVAAAEEPQQPRVLVHPSKPRGGEEGSAMWGTEPDSACPGLR